MMFLTPFIPLTQFICSQLFIQMFTIYLKYYNIEQKLFLHFSE